MKKTMKKGNGKQIIFIGLIALIIMAMQIFLPVSSEPPKHFAISGYIYKNGLGQAPIGTNFRINNTISGDSWQDKTKFVPFPGWYSYTINGTEGNSMILHAWNTSHYGEQAFSLAEDIEKNISLNTARPVELNLTIISPEDSSLYNITQNFILNISAAALGNSGSGCTFYANYNHSIIQSIGADGIEIASLPRGSVTFINWTFTSNHSGATDIIVNYSCPVEGIKLETKPLATLLDIQIEDIRPPFISRIEPQDNVSKNYSIIVFRFNASDISDIINCTFQTNTTISETKTIIRNGQINNFTIEMEDNYYLWNITCIDNSPLHNANTTSARKIVVDTIAPHFKSISPDDETRNYSRRVLISANISENMKADYVYARINWDTKSEDVSLSYQESQISGSGIYSSYFYNTSSFGWYNFTVYANDTTGNWNISDTYFFYEEGIDLMLNSSSMNLLDETIEYNIVPINLTIYNRGNKNATGVNISIYKASYPDGQEIFSIIRDVLAFSSSNINTTWTAKIGETAIIAVIDPLLETNGSIYEYDESNNLFGNNVTVDAYNIYYGNTSIDVLLSTNDDFDVITWKNSTNFFGNIYAVDSDSVVYWSDLQAIGKTKSGGDSIIDFEALDLAMNMTGIKGNVNQTYTLGGTAIQTKDFIVYGTQISDVAVINSTLAGIFKTGILWETSDGGDEFNGTQDIIFVGSINDSISSRYGLQDYELKVPARLREYIQPNLENSIDIYIELT